MWSRSAQVAQELPRVLCFYLFIFCFSFFLVKKAQPIPPELTAKLLGNRVAVSPIVTVEPRRRKFHKPITLTIPVPTAAGKGMINSYSGETPTLRLLCSITGNTNGPTNGQICRCVNLVVVHSPFCFFKLLPEVP